MATHVFTTDDESHAHSLETLNCLYEYDDFMGSIGTVIDMGCGNGRDLEWWATRTTRDEHPKPLNIRCTGVDLKTDLSITKKYKNISYLNQDLSDPIATVKGKFDVVWCHDAFQYVIDPFTTLKNWHDKTHPNGMLVIILPQSTNIEGRYQAFDQRDGCYWNWTIVSLMHILATCGWDTAGGYFKKKPNDPWLHIIAYRSEHDPMDPKKTRWFDLAEKNLIPKSAVDSLNKHGYVRQRDLLLPWIDQSLTTFAQY